MQRSKFFEKYTICKILVKLRGKNINYQYHKLNKGILKLLQDNTEAIRTNWCLETQQVRRKRLLKETQAMKTQHRNNSATNK